MIEARHHTEVHTGVFCLKRFGRLSEWNQDAQTPNICARDEARKSPGARAHAPGHQSSDMQGEEVGIYANLYRNLRGENIDSTDANLSG